MCQIHLVFGYGHLALHLTWGQHGYGHLALHLTWGLQCVALHIMHHRRGHWIRMLWLPDRLVHNPLVSLQLEGLAPPHVHNHASQCLVPCHWFLPMRSVTHQFLYDLRVCLLTSIILHVTETLPSVPCTQPLISVKDLYLTAPIMSYSVMAITYWLDRFAT